MNDTKQCIRECHTCQALCIVHGVTLCHIAVVGINQISLDHLDRMESQRIGKVAVCGRYISLDRMGHSIHTGMGNQLLRHGLCKIWIYDRNIRGDFEVCDRVLDTLLVIGNDRECGNLSCSSGCGGNCTEMSFLSQLRNTEYLTHIFKSDVRILVFDPHSLCCIDRGTAAHSYDPVWLECFHSCCTLHNSLYGRIRLDAFEKLNLHSCFFQILFCFIQKTEAFHGTAANTDHCFFAFKCL